MNSRMMSSSKILGVFGVLAMILPGCAALNLKQPTASLRSANVQNVAQDGLMVNFDMDVRNPNSVSIPVSGAKYQLGLAGVQVLSDQVKPSGTVPGNGSLPVTLPVHLSFDRLVSAEQAIARTGGNVPYTFDGNLEFRAGQFRLLPPLTVPLHFSGTLALRDALKDPQLLTSPAARRLVEAVFGRGNLGGLLDRLPQN